jgi:hypothetical protein
MVFFPNLMRFINFILCIALIGLNAAAAVPQRIITASNVRVRSAPKVQAAEVTKLAFGTLAEEIAQSAQQETINQVQAYWYRLNLPDGKAGWVFGGLTRVFDPLNKERIYCDITTARLQQANLNLGAYIELDQFITRILPEVSEPELVAELKFTQLRALQRAVTQTDKTPAFEAWIKEQEANLVYGEPQGQWLVQSELFWQLTLEYQDLPIADEIAWTAAENMLPGECEGDAACHAEALKLTYARYLLLFPNGKHAADAQKKMTE